MADEKHFPPPPSSSPRFPAWQREYDAALQEMDTTRLFKCVEVAEAAVLLRLEATRGAGCSSGYAFSRLEPMGRTPF